MRRVCSYHRSVSSRRIRFISLTVCCALFAPCFGALRPTTRASLTYAAERSRGSSKSRFPVPTPSRVNPGQDQLSREPYVPPALRADNAERRANGKQGLLVEPPATKKGAPQPNLPNLGDSRKKRKTSNAKAGSSSLEAAKFSTSSGPDQSNLICADCDPGGGGGAGGTDPYFSTARTRPINEIGASEVTLGSRNFNWGMPVVMLPGRAGLDLSISLFYNSLVWTKQGNAIQYNADHGTPAPGFQLGLPRLQAQHYNWDHSTHAYMLITPSGGRVEMKQVGSSNTYESADGSFTQLTFSGSVPVVRTTDGTQYVFGTQVSAEWRCTQIKDRNGNYISATYDTSNGHILTVTDTLARTINFNYDGDNNLETITQSWAGATHEWVRFYYTPVPMSFDFAELFAYGAVNGGSQTVLSQVVVPNVASFHFDYNSYGQVYQIRHLAPDDHELERTFYSIDTSTAQTDCPRFTERQDSAQDWNNNQAAITTYEVTEGVTWTNPESGAPHTGTLAQQTTSDGTVYKQYSHATGWDTGLTQLTEVWSGTKKKWTSTSWTQDNISLSYPLNPRVVETNIYDDEGNRRRTTLDYTSHNLPSDVREWIGSAGTTLYRRTTTAYRFDTEYLNRRIIGLVNLTEAFDGAGGLISKVTYGYDWDSAGDMFLDTPAAATQHDRTNYGPSLIYGRGNLSQMSRWDVNDPDNQSLAVEKKWRVNSTGSVLMVRDHLWHQKFMEYSDSFSDSVNRNTFAYPTLFTDAEGNSSTTQYDYDFGAVTRTHAPTSGVGGGTTYLDVVRQYDARGRLERASNQTNGAYTRFVYENNANYIHSYQTIIDLTQPNEFHSWQVMDGAGRVRASASDHPGSSGGYQGQYVIYDNMGRVTNQSNPTEMNDGWVPAGDDSSWRETVQAYDWQGRPTQTTNTDGTTQVASYGGCGCAGGEVTTVQDEHGRQRRFSKDALARLATVEELNWNGSVYATTSYTYNGRDQISQSNQAGQIRSFSYDGHGRLHTRTTPEQGTTTYSYNPDDTIQRVTDARGVTTTFGYNNRHQTTSLTYDVTGDPTGQTTATANVSFAYDAAGNRTSMSDGLGLVSYNYNNLAQLTSETRSFNTLGSYTLSYGYNLAGELNSITNPWGAQVGYGYDKAGRLQNVSGAGYAGVSNYAGGLSYRAFGAIKGMSYGNGRTLSTAYDNRLRPTTWNVANVLGYKYNYDYFNERTGRVSYAENIQDPTLDRSYEYDQVGRLAISHTGAEARAAAWTGQWGTMDGPYSQGYDYDVWGNVTHKYGWGGEVQGGGAGQSSDIYYSYTGNRRNGSGYDAAGNLTNDGSRNFSYDATGQQTYASGLIGGSGAPSFTDDPLVAGSTIIMAQHLTELRTAVNQLRAQAGLSAASWTPDPNVQATVTVVKAEHILQLRAKLAEALAALQVWTAGYAHPNLTATTSTIYAVDFQELRDRIKAAWNTLATSTLSQYYNGDGLRVKKTESGTTTWYLRSTVLGGQIVAEINGSGGWTRGYVYAGSNLLAVQQGGVSWMHEDPVTKSKRVTNINGAVVSTIELDPWGADTNRSSDAAFQPRKFTSYDRDQNGSDEAMFRRYNRKHSRFDQPDPYDGSYSLANPQSFNRYSYVQNDPVKFVDPTGLFCVITGYRYENYEYTNSEGDQVFGQRIYAKVECFLEGAFDPRVPYDPVRPFERPVAPTLPRPTPPRNPKDPDTDLINAALGICSTGASIGQYSTVNPAGTAWKGGVNGQWSRMGWGGNGSTGARSAAIGRASSYGLLSRATGTLGAGFSLYQSGQAFQQGDYDQGARRIWDAGFGLAGAFGGPVGAAASGVWFGMSTLLDSNPDLARACRCDAQCRRK